MVKIQNIQKNDNIHHSSDIKSKAPDVFIHRQKTQKQNNSNNILYGLLGLATIAIAGIAYTKGKKNS